MRSRTFNRAWFNQFIPFVVPLLILALWQWLTASGVVSANILPRPAQVLEAFIRLLGNGELLNNISISARRALGGFLIGGVWVFCWEC